MGIPNGILFCGIIIFMSDKKVCIPLNTFKDYYLTHNYNENMFNSDGSINPSYNSCKKTGVIAQIFEDYWNSFYIENKETIDKYRPNAPIENQKVQLI